MAPGVCVMHGEARAARSNPVEMAKPLQCSIETPDYCDVLPSRRERTAYRALFTRAGSGLCGVDFSFLVKSAFCQSY